jgi:type I restriction enzyme S subunit
MSRSWDYERFGDLFAYQNKSSIKAGAGLSSGLYPFYTSSVELSKFIDEFQFERNSLIFGTGGNASIHFCDKPFSVSTDCLVAYVKNETKVDSKFVFFYLKGNIGLLEKGFKGAGLKHISKGYINDIIIPLPPLATQQRIAAILDAADALRRKDQELLRKYDELAQAIFIDMFGDPVKNEKGWDTTLLGSCFKSPVKCGPFGSALKKEEYTSEGIPVWVMDNIVEYEFSPNNCLFISDSKFHDLEPYKAVNGDIIISRAGTVGKMSVVEGLKGNSIISTNLIKISLDESKLNPYFFVFLMKYFSKKIGRLKTGSDNGFTHMNTGVLEGLEFPLPSLKHQNEFIDVMSKIKAMKNKTKSSDLYFFHSLLQQAFNGELVQ